MSRPPLCRAGILGAFLWLGVAGLAWAGASDTVTAVEFASPHRFPTELVRSVVADLVGRPRSRFAIRQGLDRLWSLDLFAELWVEEVPEADGLRLRFHLSRRPFIQHIAWEGELGLPAVDLAEAARLAVGGDAWPDRLEQAQKGTLALYEREGYFSAQVDIRVREDPATNGRELTVLVHAGPRARIGRIAMHGVGEAEVERLRASLGLDPDDAYRERTVRESVQHLEDMQRQEGYFEARVRLTSSVWDPASNRVNLEIDLERGPRYVVEFHGNEALSETALLARLTFRDSGVVDATETATSAREVEAAYREVGYHFVQVSGSVHGEGDTRTIRFEVTEGPRVTVEAVTFTGNHALPVEQLADRMTTRPPGFLRSGFFRQETLDQDLRILTAYYRSQGFPDAVVGPPEVRFSDDRRRATIDIPIREGYRLRVGRIAVEGARVLSTADVLAAVPFTTGDLWVAQHDTDAKRAIGRVYAQHGHVHAQVILDTTRSDDSVHVTVRIDEGPLTRVGRILISGLTLTREYVVRRELAFAPGDPFNPEALVDTELRLAGLGVFERVQIGPLRPPPSPFADVLITVREGRPWRVEVGGGYGTSDGWRATVEVGHDNLFGTGQSASVRQRFGQYGERTDLTYRYPWLFGTPLRSDVSLFQEYHDEHIYGYKQQQMGVAAGIERTLLPVPLKDLYRLRLGLRYQLAWVRNYDVSSSLVTAGPDAITPGSQLIGKITPAVTADYRDNLVDPKRGSFHTLSVDVAGPYLGSEANFVKSRLETRWFFELPLQTTLALAGRIGLAGPYGDSDSLPSSERFYAGGSATIRGYPQDKVGPLDGNGNPLGGNALLIGNVEWRFPIWRWLGGVAFLDTGVVAPNVGSLNLSSFKTGVGGGLRIMTPVGPIRFDAGYAVNPIPGSDRWQLYFAIGQAF